MKEEMDSIVEQYIEKQEQLLEKKETIRRNKKLIKWGLFEEVPSKETEPGSYYNAEKKEYVKKVALHVSDEDYKTINQYKEKTDEKIRIDQIIKGIAYAIFLIGGFIGLLALGESPLISLSTWASSFVSGVLFLGLAKIIELLEEIKKNTSSDE